MEVDSSSSDSSSSQEAIDDGLLLGMMVVASDILFEEMDLDEHAELKEFALDLTDAVFEAMKENEDHERDRNAMMRPKRVIVKYDRQRAKDCVERDYLGPSPLFRDRQFERFFRITRSHAENLLNTLAHNTLFFRTGFDCTGRPSIDPKVKLLISLKILCYGTSGSAYQDYFQMGVSTAQLCFKNFCKAVSTDTTFTDIYLRQITRSDAWRVTKLHLDQHGVDGMLGSLDCCHFYWKNCPMAWQGAFKGKGSHPSIVLEAFCDYNLWIWHSSFGYAGSLNDINIWDQSPLLESFVDGSFAKYVDFDFEIDGKTFHRLWILTDGIYPELARFVKTLDEGVTPQRRRYISWQESCRKDIERAFGVLQRKFQMLKRPIEQWFLHDIKDIVQTSLILHNMMVEHRISEGQQESENLYQQTENEDIEAEYMNQVDPDEEKLATDLAENYIQQKIENSYYTGHAVNLTTQNTRQNEKWHGFHAELTLRRWKKLYDAEEHYKLRDAIINEVNKKP